MKKGDSKKVYPVRLLTACLLLLLAFMFGCATSGSQTAEKSSSQQSGEVTVHQPMEIPEDVSCGKCGMFPAKYPRWQSQIIFKDGTMTPFDGCKCMFNFISAMGEFDKTHTMDDVSAVWVKDFNSATWINAVDAYYVVGSNMMGPMGKEVIPFTDQSAAMKFHQEQGGSVMMYSQITPEVLKTLGMGGMKMEQGSHPMKM
jgi:nitrous oxide reductase accessory protein NosL